MPKLFAFAALAAASLFASPAFAAAGLNTSVYHSDGTPDYTFVNTNDALAWHAGYGGESSTIVSFFGADAAGAALTDTSWAQSFRVDSQGYINVPTAATYIFNLTADNAAELLIDGTTVADVSDWSIPSNGNALALSAGFHSFDLNFRGDGLPNGMWLTFSGGPLSFSTTNSVTAAVPEPATWAMMLLGFGAIGFTMRRKRTAALVQVA